MSYAEVAFGRLWRFYCDGCNAQHTVVAGKTPKGWSGNSDPLDEVTPDLCPDCIKKATKEKELAELERLALDFANCADVGRRLESQLAAMTAERDAARHEIDTTLTDSGYLMGERDRARSERNRSINERDAARAERDAANLKREQQWKELQAARADAAAMRAVAQVIIQEAKWSTTGYTAGISVYDVDKLKAFIAGDAGRALLAYVTAFEAEHEAVGFVVKSRSVQETMDAIAGLTAAHAAVEALRTVKP